MNTKIGLKNNTYLQKGHKILKILVLGENGQVGQELQRALQPVGEILSLDRSV